MRSEELIYSSQKTETKADSARARAVRLTSGEPRPILTVMQTASRSYAYSSYRYAPRNTGRASRRLRV